MNPRTEARRLAALAAQVGHYRLVFRWPERTASLLLPALFVLSVAVHALAFYVFQVVYPPTVVSAPARGQVTLLAPGTPQGDALLRRVQAQDPATAARIQEITPSGLGEIPYIPSYATAKMPLKEGEAPAENIGFPSAHSLLDQIGSKSASPANVPRLSVASSLSFSETLCSRESAGQPQQVKLTAKSSANLRPTVFLVGIGDRGEVRYSFLQESSTDPVMDAQAETLLRQHGFSRSETPLEWGFATFTWGAEAYAPHSSQPLPQPAAVPGI